MDKIILQGLRVSGILGVHEWERQRPRPIVIQITLFVDTRRAGRSDDLADCVDYSLLAGRVREHVAHAARHTVEALANDLAALCLEMPGVQKAIVRVDKPGAIPEAESVGVEVERKRADFL